MPSYRQPCNRAVTRAAAGPQIGGVGPIGHVIQIVASTVGIVRFVFCEQITKRRRRIGIASSINRARGRRAIASVAVLPMMGMAIVLKGSRDILILRRFTVGKNDHEGPAATHDLRRRGPGRSMILPKEIRIAPAGIRDVSGRTCFRPNQCRQFTAFRSNRHRSWQNSRRLKSRPNTRSDRHSPLQMWIESARHTWPFHTRPR